ncbi:MAG TPA: ABC transporter permease [Actinomycetales bacterium]|jgi:simple sugar transport system permease protein|nr:ABC transporter permease [Actinomycetales bacterium]
MSVTTDRIPEKSAPGEPASATARRGWVGDVLITVLSIVLALLVGAVLIAVADPRVQETASYFFSRPQDMLQAVGSSVGNAYAALFKGAVLDYGAETMTAKIRPITESLVFASPLIVAGLAVGLAFRAGLFNIGAEGQIILGAIGAAYVGFTWHLPVVLHMVLAVLAAMLLGALWGGIPGFLKARTGAHEVITTIMLNYVARFLLAFLLSTTAFQRPGRNDPISPQVDKSAMLPQLLGSWSRLHLGLALAVAAAFGVWWLLNRSTIGFKLRAVGANPFASKTAGINVGWSTFAAMAIAGSLAGLAGAFQIIGTEKALTGGVSAGIGFDAITVALLGRGNPFGIVLAGFLFGALKAGGVTMQARTGTPIDLVLVVQSLIVLFIAAPPLVRAIFRIRAQGAGSMQVSKGWNA